MIEIIDKIIGWAEKIVPLMISLAIVVFFWGLVKFIWHAGDEKTHDEGKAVMIWGMVSLFVMVALWAIIGWLQGVTGIKGGIGGEVPGVTITLP